MRVIILCFLLATVSGRSVKDELAANPDLSNFLAAIEKEPLTKLVVEYYAATVFAPNNAAVERWRQANPNLDLKTAAAAHVCGSYLKKQDFPRTITSSSAFQNLFLTVKDSAVLSKGHSLSPTQSPQKPSPLEYYVSNAKIVGEGSDGLKSSEGRPQSLFIIDEVIESYQRAGQGPQPDAYDFLTGKSIYEPSVGQSYSNFAELLSRYPVQSLFKLNGNHTFFVPVDSKTTSRLDQYQVRAHVIPNRVLNLRVFQGNKEYDSAMWDSNIAVSINKPVPNVPTEAFEKSLQALTRIESHTRRSNASSHHLGTTRTGIIKANVPVSNGVIHFIESPFTTITNSVWDLLESNKDGQLSKFYQLISDDDVVLNQVKSSAYTTVFAPSNAAFEKLEKRNLTGPLRDKNSAAYITRLHIAARQITMEDVRNNLNQSKSLDPSKELYLQIAQASPSLQVLTVEGGGVNATALHPDMGATNGRVHIIDKVLGIPYQTVYEKIHDDFDLHTTYVIGSHRNDYWNRHLNSPNKKFTYFAPSSLAWKKISIEYPSEHKQLVEGLYAQHGEHVSYT